MFAEQFLTGKPSCSNKYITKISTTKKTITKHNKQKQGNPNFNFCTKRDNDILTICPFQIISTRTVGQVYDKSLEIQIQIQPKQLQVLKHTDTVRKRPPKQITTKQEIIPHF